MDIKLLEEIHLSQENTYLGAGFVDPGKGQVDWRKRFELRLKQDSIGLRVDENASQVERVRLRIPIQIQRQTNVIRQHIQGCTRVNDCRNGDICSLVE